MVLRPDLLVEHVDTIKPMIGHQLYERSLNGSNVAPVGVLRAQDQRDLLYSIY
jgi:hypothetical protein